MLETPRKGLRDGGFSQLYFLWLHDGIPHAPQFLENLRGRGCGGVAAHVGINDEGARRNVIAEEGTSAIGVAVLLTQVHVDPARKKSSQVRVHYFELGIIRRGTRRAQREKDQRGLRRVGTIHQN